MSEKKNNHDENDRVESKAPVIVKVTYSNNKPENRKRSDRKITNNNLEKSI